MLSSSIKTLPKTPSNFNLAIILGMKLLFQRLVLSLISRSLFLLSLSCLDDETLEMHLVYL